MENTVYKLEADGKTMTVVNNVEAADSVTAVLTVAEPNELGEVITQHAYEITEARSNKTLIGRDDPFEVHITINIPHRDKVVEFVGKGKSFEEAHKAIEVDVRREVSFWRFCIGVNRGEDRFKREPVPYEKRRDHQLFHGGESDVTRACSPLTGQTHPHRHSG